MTKPTVRTFHQVSLLDELVWLLEKEKAVNWTEIVSVDWIIKWLKKQKEVIIKYNDN